MSTPQLYVVFVLQIARPGQSPYIKPAARASALISRITCRSVTCDKILRCTCASSFCKLCSDGLPLNASAGTKPYTVSWSSGRRCPPALDAAATSAQVRRARPPGNRRLRRRLGRRGARRARVGGRATVRLGAGVPVGVEKAAADGVAGVPRVDLSFDCRAVGARWWPVRSV